MAHYAEVKNGIVTNVIVTGDSGVKDLPGKWVQTSYRTREGQHPEGKPLRKNFAGIGHIYDAELDAFYPPCPGDQFKLDKEKGCWVDTRPEADSDEVEPIRMQEYPSAAELLDAIVQGDQEQLDKYIAKCQAVKIKNPKP